MTDLPPQNYGRHFKKNFLLAYPVMLSQLGHVLVGVADSMMVGKLGAVPLAAASLANVVFYLLYTFGLGVSYAITPLVAAADGERNPTKIAEVLKHGLTINMATGTFILCAVLAGRDLLYLLRQPPEVLDAAMPYLFIISLSILPFMLFQTFRQFAEGLSFTRQAMQVSLAANVVNVGLNYVLIYGYLGFPALGLEGAGIATLASRVLMGVVMMAYIYYAPRFRAYRAGFSFKHYKAALTQKMLGIGIPAGLQFLFEVGAFGCAAIMMGWIGTQTLAAHQIAINMASISYMMASGLGAAATIRVGNQLGQNDIPALRAAGFTIFAMVGAFMAFAALVFFLGRWFLPTLYIDDQEVIALAGPLLAIAGLFQLSDGLQVVGLGALRGLEDVKVPTVYTFVAYWVVGLPGGYLLAFAFGMGGEGIWYGLLIGLSIAASTLYLRFARLSKRLLARQGHP